MFAPFAPRKQFQSLALLWLIIGGTACTFKPGANINFSKSNEKYRGPAAERDAPTLSEIISTHTSGAKQWNLSWTMSDNKTAVKDLKVTIRKIDGKTATQFPTSADTVYKTDTGILNLQNESGSDGYFINYLITVSDAVGNETSKNISIRNDVSGPTVTKVSIDNVETNLRDVALSITVLDGPGTTGEVKSLTIYETLSKSCKGPAIASQDLTYLGSSTKHTYRLSALPDDKYLCFKAKDSQANDSTISDSGVGTFGVDKLIVSYSGGLAPPEITNFTLTNSVTSSQTVFTSGQGVVINYALKSIVGLPKYPVKAIQYSLDTATWVNLPGTSEASFGSSTVGALTWSGTYSGWTAPTSSTFYLRIIIDDINGQRSRYFSQLANGGSFSYYMGQPKDCPDGVSNLSIRVPGISPTTLPVTRSKFTGDIWFYLEQCPGIFKADALTGLVSLVFAASTSGLGANPRSIIEDSEGSMYVNGANGNGILKFNPRVSAPTLSTYTANGSLVSGITDPAQLKIWEVSPMAIDQNDQIYVLTTDVNVSSATEPRYIYKIGRSGSGPGGLTLIAGNGSSGDPTLGQTAATSTLSVTYIYWTTLTPNEDGSIIYTNISTVGNRKIVNGVWQSVQVPANAGTGFAFNASEQGPEKFYAYHLSTNPGRLEKFAPTSTSNSEVMTTIAAGFSTDPTCATEGQPIASSCLDIRYANRESMIFDAKGGFIVNEGFPQSGGGENKFRVITYVNGKRRTILGRPEIPGLGGDKLYVQGVSLAQFSFDPSGNLYVMDNGESKMLKVDSSSITSLYTGNGTSFLPTVGYPRSGNSLSYHYAGGTLSIGALASGVVFYRSRNQIYFVDSAGIVQATPNTTYLTQNANGATGNVGNTNINGSGTGIATDTSGNLYVTSAYYNQVATNPAPRVIKIENPTSTAGCVIRWIAGIFSGALGVNSNLTSVDGATASSSTIKVDDSGTWATGQAGYNLKAKVVGTKVYFNEVDRIRTVSALDGTGVLGTLADGDGTLITGLQTIYDFAVAGSRLFVLGSDLVIRCRWLGTSVTMPADCTGTSISSSMLSPGRVNGTMEIDSNGDLIFTRSGKGNLMKYDVP